MPYLIYPQSDFGRLKLLDRVTVTAADDVELGKAILPAELLTDIETQKSAYQSVYDKFNASLSTKSKEVREKQECFSNLDLYVRDFFDVLKRRTIRLEHPAEILRFYNVAINGELPDFRKDEDLLKTGENIVKGDANAIAAGFPAMANPSAEELGVVLTAAKKEMAEIVPADRAYEMVQKELGEMRMPIDELIREIADYIQFAGRRDNPSNVRRTMRTYGFEYRYLKNEPVEEDIVETETAENK
ncbi:hypothetical protein [Marinifilum flexuosum]|uniref:Uncharacterized protein n=1 Tax=Marinifilum flexuosum TaxID=1117708 RepID=A0A419WSX2_9BACT|nr:hypothetical protein [Marinifilum flexuosum]RKD98506.1 hypothetical protein BXY64_3365 [Marinifilum flexuosum]